jgi:hypothetical protein
MLLSKDAIADVVEVLRPDDFYRPAHQTVYECILDLYGRGEPADAVTVSAELQRRGDLMRLGGAPYLHTLIATVPTAANAAYYAEIVAEKATLRRLVEAGTRIVQLGYHGGEGAEVSDVVDRAQAAIYDVTERSTSEDYVPLEELLQPTMDEIDAIASRGGVSLGVPTGFADLDAATNGLHPGQMVVIAARPGLGKSTLGLDFARACSVKHGMTSVVFSLEMSRSEIVMRLLSAEARIRLSDMRSGRMSDDDWTRMARRMSEISEAPLFIDDSPNLTLMEIRAKARRLKQRNDLRLATPMPTASPRSGTACGPSGPTGTLTRPPSASSCGPTTSAGSTPTVCPRTGSTASALTPGGSTAPGWTDRATSRSSYSSSGTTAPTSTPTRSSRPTCATIARPPSSCGDGTTRSSAPTAHAPICGTCPTPSCTYSMPATSPSRPIAERSRR